jgi:hypothetical protein
LSHLRRALLKDFAFELRVIGGKHIRQHSQNAFLLVDCITPQMSARALRR